MRWIRRHGDNVAAQADIKARCLDVGPRWLWLTIYGLWSCLPKGGKAPELVRRPAIKSYDFWKPSVRLVSAKASSLLTEWMQK